MGGHEHGNHRSAGEVEGEGARVECGTISSHTHPRAQQICLRHLQGLFLGLEERAGKSDLDFVHSDYRMALSSALEAALSAAMSATDCSPAVPFLRDLLTAMRGADTAKSCLAYLLFVVAQARFPASDGLKLYMADLTEEEIEDSAWYTELPDDLQVGHAYALFKFLSRA